MAHFTLMNQISASPWTTDGDTLRRPGQRVLTLCIALDNGCWHFPSPRTSGGYCLAWDDICKWNVLYEWGNSCYVMNSEDTSKSMDTRDSRNSGNSNSMNPRNSRDSSNSNSMYQTNSGDTANSRTPATGRILSIAVAKATVGTPGCNYLPESHQQQRLL